MSDPADVLVPPAALTAAVQALFRQAGSAPEEAALVAGQTTLNDAVATLLSRPLKQE